MRRSETDFSFTVTAFQDEEAGVWVASSVDIPGLATEAESVDGLVGKLKVMVPELLKLNGVVSGEITSVPFQLTAQVDGADHRH